MRQPAGINKPYIYAGVNNPLQEDISPKALQVYQATDSTTTAFAFLMNDPVYHGR